MSHSSPFPYSDLSVFELQNYHEKYSCKNALRFTTSIDEKQESKSIYFETLS